MRRLSLVCLSALALAACTGTPAVQAPSPQASVSPPAGMNSLRTIYLAHGPANFFLPAGIADQSRIDEPNVVTLSYGLTDGKILAPWLLQRLPGWGWTLDAHRDTSLVFHDADWQGAFTCSSSLCALTLRHQAS